MTIPIPLVADNIFEGVEVFGLSITNDFGAVEFQFGDFPSTFINLTDRRKQLCLYYRHVRKLMCSFLSFFSHTHVM